MRLEALLAEVAPRCRGGVHDAVYVVVVAALSIPQFQEAAADLMPDLAALCSARFAGALSTFLVYHGRNRERVRGLASGLTLSMSRWPVRTYLSALHEPVFVAGLLGCVDPRVAKDQEAAAIADSICAVVYGSGTDNQLCNAKNEGMRECVWRLLRRHAGTAPVPPTDADAITLLFESDDVHRRPAGAVAVNAQVRDWYELLSQLPLQAAVPMWLESGTARARDCALLVLSEMNALVRLCGTPEARAAWIVGPGHAWHPLLARAAKELETEMGRGQGR